MGSIKQTLPSPLLPVAPFILDSAEFQEKYDRVPFAFRHRLAGHPLLSLPALFDLAREMTKLGKQYVQYWHGDVPIGSHFGHPTEETAFVSSLEEAMLNFEQSGAFILINCAERSPAYKKLLDEVLDQVEGEVGLRDPGMSQRIAYIFIAAPGGVTPFHLDREITFLCQIQGKKTFYLWRPDDSVVVQQQSLERLFATNTNPRPNFQEEYMDRAMVFEMSPGDVVHSPFHAPHCAKAGDELSIAIGCTYRTLGTNRRARIHRVNHRLRKYGFRPSPLGTHPIGDTIKEQTLRVWEKGVRVLRR